MILVTTPKKVQRRVGLLSYRVVNIYFLIKSYGCSQFGIVIELSIGNGRELAMMSIQTFYLGH